MMAPALIGLYSFLVLAVADSAATVPAFPGADGYGKYTTGGRGGKVIAVTSLEDDGPGTLRAALEAEGPRIIVFRVSGTIVLQSELSIRNGNVTVVGQSAPGDGICLRNYRTMVTADNVIIRFLRFRLGDEARQQDDALCAMGCKNVIIDHCSMSWGIDEVGTFYNNEEFTLQWCIISESLYSSVHRKGAHGYGGIWGGSRVSFHHNLLAHHSSRNPRFQGGRTKGSGDRELVDFRNNVVYNWGFKCAYGGELGRQNVVANYFKPGPATLRKSRFLEPDEPPGKWYVAENVVAGFPEVMKDNWRHGVREGFDADGRMPDPFPFLMAATQHAEDAFRDVLRFAGALLPRRDAVDRRIIDETRGGTTTYGSPTYAADNGLPAGASPLGIIDSQAAVGGWPVLAGKEPPVDSDNDGMPDEWERANGLNPHSSSDGASIGADGYSNLERYLNELVASVI